MRVRNYMEDVVEFLLPNILSGEKYKNQCTCQMCINDIKAIALNNIQPKYVATEKGEVLFKANILTVQSDVDVIRALVNAIDKVSKLPRHEGAK